MSKATAKVLDQLKKLLASFDWVFAQLKQFDEPEHAIDAFRARIAVMILSAVRYLGNSADSGRTVAVCHSAGNAVRQV
ncbi:MAG: hypothetical protein SGI92_15825 [Bryobacteraceae bacterium]|nr:hypothetical protein [Bryobacteraceae bacterium]